MNRRPVMKSEFLVEIGEGCLFLGSDGQCMKGYSKDPVAKANAPDHRSSFDTAHIGRYDGTDLCQWQGRGSDGYFHAYGRIMRIVGGPASLDAEALQNQQDRAQGLYGDGMSLGRAGE